MKSASLLMKNTLLLAASNIILRLCVLCFQAYLASKIGAHQLGIFGIIASVEMVFATVSISGVRFSVTRIVSEEINSDNNYPTALMACAFRYAIFFGLLACCGMFLLSGRISSSYIGDVEAVLPLRIMALSMPSIALGSCAEGYFTAKQKVFRLITAMLFAQAVRILFVKLSFDAVLFKGAYPADILATGAALGEVTFSLAVCIMYIIESFGKKEKTVQKKYFPRLVKTAMPLAVSAYMRTGLSSLGQVIIPAGLKKSGMGSVGAFSVYGVITQMAMPVLMFPIAFLSALGEVLIPRLTGAQVKNRKIGISYIVNRALRVGIIFSFGIMGIMFFFAGELGETIYKSTEAGTYIRAFTPLIPIIYIDCVTDGCLKGLGQQVHSMFYNILEGILNVGLLFILLPRMAMGGYILVMYIKEIFNSYLSIRRLSVITSVDISIKALLSAMASVPSAWILCSFVGSGLPLVFKITLYVIFYVMLLYIVNAVTRDDIKWILSNVKSKEQTN